MRLPVEVIEKAEREYRPSPGEVEKIRQHISKESAVVLDPPAHVERRRRMIAAVAVENVADAYERYIGENELLPINYLLLGYLQSRAVGRIRYFDRRVGKGAVATGFLVSDNLVMTNHHVFPVANRAEFDALAQEPTIDFNHEYDIDGNRPDSPVFALAPEDFLYTSKELDVALVAVRISDTTGKHSLKSQGYLVLNGALGKAGRGDFASIIQHPQGSEKQIAIRKNEIISTDLPEAIIYVSDTAQGSSGAPVFNDQWQVIALHSAGVAKKDAQGNFIDKNQQVIEVINGLVDEERIVWESNRGTRVSTIMTYLNNPQNGVAAHPLIQALYSPAYTDSRPYAFLSRPALGTERATVVVASPGSGVQPPTILTPPAAITALHAPVAPLNISISISPNGGTVTTTTGSARAPADIAIAFEKKYEDELDFSDCDGFDENFMGVYIPMPTPSNALRARLAFLSDSPSAYTLKYHHISTLHHAVRRVPVVSGINVHARYRYDELDVEGSRTDKWYRDNRIDYDVQLNDAFYKYSGFDKGHLSRREDAEWGRSVAKAKLAADLTCSYANAAPQVPALNRATHGYTGRWGRLEQILLEEGIENEEGKAARICVFNGPLFDEDDPVFKGVQVALSFYKIVVWYDGNGQLRTTCYRLSQEQLVGQIEFEVLHFDEVFKTYQTSISRIETRTGLKFHPNIADVDTYAGDDQPIV